MITGGDDISDSSVDKLTNFATPLTAKSRMKYKHTTKPSSLSNDWCRQTLSRMVQSTCCLRCT